MYTAYNRWSIHSQIPMEQVRRREDEAFGVVAEEVEAEAVETMAEGKLIGVQFSLLTNSFW